MNRNKKKISTQVLEYTVTVHRAEEGGFWAEVPALAGCFTQGETIEETLENAKDAIQSHLEALRSEGSAIPSDQDVFIGRVAVHSGR